MCRVGFALFQSLYSVGLKDYVPVVTLMRVRIRKVLSLGPFRASAECSSEVRGTTSRPWLLGSTCGLFSTVVGNEISRWEAERQKSHCLKMLLSSFSGSPP